MKAVVYFAMLSLVVHATLGQTTTASHGASQPTIKSTSTLVIVPTLVQYASGDQVINLDASDFRLTDNGVEQKVSVEPTKNQPLAVVVLMQTGGAAFSRLQSYIKLDTMVEDMLGASSHKVALVMFDSRPEQIWSFPTSVDALYYALIHPKGGDHGAAILDAVTFAISLLQQQPASFRRIILLLSQARDSGSKVRTEEVVRGLAESATTIYSFTYSPSPESTLLSDTIAGSTSLAPILEAMRENSAAEVAALSGGKRIKFHDEHDLEAEMSSLAREIHSGYILSFHPTSHAPGFHAIGVQVLKKQSRVEVTSRKNYWFDETVAE